MIRHLVMWRLTTDDPAERARIVAEMAKRFAPLVDLVDGLERLDIRSDLGAVAANWHVLLDADYRDAAALAEYQTHPDHVAAAAYVKSVVAERSCIDFEQ